MAVKGGYSGQTLTAVVSDTRQREQRGKTRYDWNETYDCMNYYEYKQYDSGAAASSAAGNVLIFADDDNTEQVTTDVSDVTNPCNFGAGYAAAVVSAGGWLWVQKAGVVVATTNADDDISKGDMLYPDVSHDGDVDSIAYGTAPAFHIIGIALAADVDGSDTVLTRIVNLYP